MARIFLFILLLCAYTLIFDAGSTECVAASDQTEASQQAKREWLAGEGKHREKYDGETSRPGGITVTGSKDAAQAKSLRNHKSGEDRDTAYHFVYETIELGDQTRKNTFIVETSYRTARLGTKAKAKTPGGMAMILDYGEMRETLAKHFGIDEFDFIGDGATTGEIIRRNVINKPLTRLFDDYFSDKGLDPGSSVTVSGDSTGREKDLFENFFDLLPDPDNPDKFTSHNGTQTKRFLEHLSKREGKTYIPTSIKVESKLIFNGYAKIYDVTVKVAIAEY